MQLIEMEKIAAIEKAILVWLSSAVLHKDIQVATWQYMQEARRIATQLDATVEEVLAVWACYLSADTSSLRAMRILPSTKHSG